LLLKRREFGDFLSDKIKRQNPATRAILVTGKTGNVGPCWVINHKMVLTNIVQDAIIYV